MEAREIPEAPLGGKIPDPMFPVHRLRIEDGDILVVRLPRGTMGDVYRHVRERLGADLKAAGHGSVPVIVCDESMGLEVFRPEPGTSPYTTRQEVGDIVAAALPVFQSGPCFGPIQWPAVVGDGSGEALPPIDQSPSGDPRRRDLLAAGNSSGARRRARPL